MPYQIKENVFDEKYMFHYFSERFEIH